jgi:translation initiation factor 1
MSAPARSTRRRTSARDRASYRLGAMAKRSRRDTDAEVVFSTSGGDRRKQRRAERRDQAPPAEGGRVKVRREVAGRRGKPVTTVSNVPVDDAALKELAGRLKRRCGVGGSAKGGVIELQGDHRDVDVEVLRAEGFDVVLAGG